MTEVSPTSENDKVRASRLGIIILAAVSIGLAGPIAVNIHQAAHVLCAVKGECFGETRWLEGISALPMWNMLFGTGAGALFILSAISYVFVFPRVWPALLDSHIGDEEEIPSLAQLKKSALICMIFSSILWMTMLVISITLYQGAIS